MLDYLVIEFLQLCLLLQVAVPQLEKKVLAAARHLGICGKVHVQQILPQGSGKGFPENFKVFESVLLWQGEEGIRDLCLFLLFPVHIAAADAGNGAVFIGKLLLDVGYFFLVHSM